MKQLDLNKLEEIQKEAEVIWKLADNIPYQKRALTIKEHAEMIRELVNSLKDSDG